MAYRIQAGDDDDPSYLPHVPSGYPDDPSVHPNAPDCISTEEEGCSPTGECCEQVSGRIVYDKSWEETETAISCGSASIPAATKANDGNPHPTRPFSHTFRAFACARFQYEQNDDIWSIDESKEIRGDRPFAP